MWKKAFVKIHWSSMDVVSNSQIMPYKIYERAIYMLLLLIFLLDCIFYIVSADAVFFVFFFGLKKTTKITLINIV